MCLGNAINMCQSMDDDRQLTLQDTFVYISPGAHLSTSYPISLRLYHWVPLLSGTGGLPI